MLDLPCIYEGCRTRWDEINNLLILKEYLDMFPEELPRLPLEREIEVSIDVLLNVSLIAQLLYKMALAELAEFKIQLQEKKFPFS